MTPEQIAQGGTYGLILALIVAVIFLARFALAAYADVKAQRDHWFQLADKATDGWHDAVEENKRLTTAIEARNRIEEDRLRSPK